MNSPREFVPTDLIEKMTVAITLGNTKESLGQDLTPYQSQFFDNLQTQIRGLLDQGMTLDIPHEIPDLVITGLVSTDPLG